MSALCAGAFRAQELHVVYFFESRPLQPLRNISCCVGFRRHACPREELNVRMLPHNTHCAGSPCLGYLAGVSLSFTVLSSISPEPYTLLHMFALSWAPGRCLSESTLYPKPYPLQVRLCYCFVRAMFTSTTTWATLTSIVRSARLTSTMSFATFTSILILAIQMFHYSLCSSGTARKRSTLGKQCWQRYRSSIFITVLFHSTL